MNVGTMNLRRSASTNATLDVSMRIAGLSRSCETQGTSNLSMAAKHVEHWYNVQLIQMGNRCIEWAASPQSSLL